MKKFGMPYQGSKSRIAEEIIGMLPAGGVFYDLFAGGCAMTHAAITSEKWNKCVCNDINGMPFEFVKVIRGDTEYLHKWVSREDFKTATALQRLIWSFNNNQKTYLFSTEAEPIKHLFWEMIHLWKIPRLNLRKVIQRHENALKDFFMDAACARFSADATKQEIIEDYAKLCEEGRALLNQAKTKAGIKSADADRHLGNQMSGHYFGKSQWEFPTDENLEKMAEIMPELKNAEFVAFAKKFKAAELAQSLQRLESLQSLESLQRLEKLESLESLQSLESLESAIEPCSVDYRSVDLSRPGVVYCDIPYYGTEDYASDFNHADFWAWAEGVSKIRPVFVSEITAPDNWQPVWQKDIKNLFSNKEQKETRREKLFTLKK